MPEAGSPTFRTSRSRRASHGGLSLEQTQGCIPLHPCWVLPFDPAAGRSLVCRSRPSLETNTCGSQPTPPAIEFLYPTGSAAGGDGHVSYAARRRNAACRPPALGRLHGAHESLPQDGA
jgi:hypothetical protein